MFSFVVEEFYGTQCQSGSYTFFYKWGAEFTVCVVFLFPCLFLFHFNLLL